VKNYINGKKKYISWSYALLSVSSSLATVLIKIRCGKTCFFRDSSTLFPCYAIAGIINLRNDIKNCSSRKDSTQAFLLQRIGVAYYMLGDYLKAVEYEKNS